MKLKRFIQTLSFTSALGVLMATPVQAGSPCKGLEQSVCSAKASCRWVNSYKRSNGKQVAGYCRKLPASRKQASGKKPESELKQG